MTKTEVLHALEHEMVDANVRGHVYITRNTVLLSATAMRRGQTRNFHKSGEIVQYAMDRILGGRGRSEEWLEGFRKDANPNGTRVAPVAWNTPHLVVTGTMPTLALAVALTNRKNYPEECIRTLMEEAGIQSEAEAERLHQETFHGYRAHRQRGPE